ncbi:hypothetical protein STEG23_017827, partial [Scotinomys teguina]
SWNWSVAQHFSINGHCVAWKSGDLWDSAQHCSERKLFRKISSLCFMKKNTFDYNGQREKELRQMDLDSCTLWTQVTDFLSSSSSLTKTKG